MRFEWGLDSAPDAQVHPEVSAANRAGRLRRCQPYRIFLSRIDGSRLQLLPSSGMIFFRHFFNSDRFRYQ